MIVLTFRAKAAPENCTELRQSLGSMLKRVQKLEGCLSCHCYRSIEDDCDFFIIEQWASQKHLNAHMCSDLYSAIQGAFRVLTDGFKIELARIGKTIQIGN